MKDLLGKRWNLINGLSIAFVLYILTYAYITSGGGITQHLLNQFSAALTIRWKLDAAWGLYFLLRARWICLVIN